MITWQIRTHKTSHQLLMGTVSYKYSACVAIKRVTNEIKPQKQQKLQLTELILQERQCWFAAMTPPAMVWGPTTGFLRVSLPIHLLVFSIRINLKSFWLCKVPRCHLAFPGLQGITAILSLPSHLINLRCSKTAWSQEDHTDSRGSPPRWSRVRLCVPELTVP